MRAVAVTSAQRLKGVNVPTLKEQGVDVEIGNWRGVYGAPGISDAQRKALTDMIVKATKSKAWGEAMEKNNWTAALMTGKDFDDFVDREFASLRATMVKAGMI
jgi:putative tricarboxylic transport membrane protein